MRVAYRRVDRVLSSLRMEITLTGNKTLTPLTIALDNITSIFIANVRRK